MNRRKCFTCLQHFYKQKILLANLKLGPGDDTAEKKMYLKLVLNRESITFISFRKDLLRDTNVHCRNPFFFQCSTNLTQRYEDQLQLIQIHLVF